jgi:mannose-6-phosphate isomerase-like protein (cupin superfamily)
MKCQQLDLAEGFRVLFAHAGVQAAVMVIAPGDAEGGPGNRHRGADQWLYVIDGDGEAVVEGRRVPLSTGSLLLVERGERHAVKNTGSRPLQTLNLYAPPAYDAEGEPLPAGED